MRMTSMTWVRTTALALLIAVFLLSTAFKLADVPAWEASVASITWLGPVRLGVLPRLVLAAEAVVTLALLLPGTRRPGLVAAGVLLLAFTGLLLIQLLAAVAVAAGVRVRRRPVPEPRDAVAWRSAGGFTLVELLVVLGMIALLMAILLPTLAGVRERGRDVTCQNNLRQASTLAASWAAERHGTLPLDGEVRIERAAGQHRPGVGVRRIEVALPVLDRTGPAGRDDVGDVSRHDSPVRRPRR